MAKEMRGGWEWASTGGLINDFRNFIVYAWRKLIIIMWTRPCFVTWNGVSLYGSFCSDLKPRSSRHGNGRRHRLGPRFVVYSIYAWGVPTLIVLIGQILDNSADLPNNIVKPNFGKPRCWFEGEFSVSSAKVYQVANRFDRFKLQSRHTNSQMIQMNKPSAGNWA